MPLCLTITSYHKLTPGQCSEKRLDRGELKIGRGPENDWVLPDPERLVSTQHCVIQCRDGNYYLTDTSTNGVILGSSGLRLRRGNSELLQDGELLKLGNYDIQVRVEAGFGAADGSAVPVDFDALLGGSNSLGSNPAPQPFAAAPATAPSMGRPLGGGSPLDTNPDLFDFLNQAPAPSATPVAADHLSADRHAFTPPPARAVEPQSQAATPVIAPGPAAIPADWDPFADLTPSAPPAQPPAQPTARAELPSGFEPLSPPAAAAPLTVEPLIAEPLVAEPVQAEPALAAAPPAVEPAVQVAAEPAQPQLSATAPAQFQEPQAPLAQYEMPSTPPAPLVQPQAPRAEAAAALPAGADLLQAFLRGAGVPQLSLGAEQALTQMESIGRSYRQMVEGLIDVLRARASLKGEFRMSQTMIRPVENNPLKFAPNVEEALLLLLRPGSQAFMPPDQAVAESFEDLRAHQLAVMAGVQAAIRHLLGRFQPSVLEERMEKPSGFAKLLPGARQSQYWALFTELYAGISREAEDDFQELFGREFTRAYEEQTARLRKP
jgi:type VI secretion system protein